MLGGVLSVKHAVGLRAFAVFKFDGTRLPTDEGVVTGVGVRIPPPALHESVRAQETFPTQSGLLHARRSASAGSDTAHTRRGAEAGEREADERRHRLGGTLWPH